MEIIFILLVLLYAAFCLVMLTAWRKMESCSGGNLKTFPGISVIIPVRNEINNIGNLLKQLMSQDYPADSYEIIVVDDDSVDGTRKAVEAIIANTEMNVKLVISNRQKYPVYSPKKAAIQTALDHASYDLILQIDGDSSIGPAWIASHISFYQAYKPKLIAGTVIFPKNGFVHQILQIEFASLIGIGAATIGLGKPTMCNGANLLFEKTAFLKAGGFGKYAHYSSGDDEFMLHIFHTAYPGHIMFNKDLNGMVTTMPPTTPGEFFSQRIRWASKWRIPHGIQNKLLALFIFTMNLAFIIALILTIIIPEFQFGVPAIIWIIKLIFEYFLLYRIMTDLGQKMNIFPFLIAGILYPFYAVLFGILSNFITPRWKSRVLETKK